MIELVVTSLLWGLSFGLIKAEVSGLNPFFVSFVRLGLSALVFAPLLRKTQHSLRLMAIGFIQFGVMYCLYITSYQYLAGHQIAVLTVTTPLFVVLIDGAIARRLTWMPIGAAALAIAGGLAIALDPSKGELRPALIGVALVQVANLCFAAGQILYRNLRRSGRIERDASAFGWLYIGSLLAPLLAVAWGGAEAVTWPERASQWWSLVYLGLIPSGLGFFLWNRGVAKVEAATAAVMNNAKVPAAVLIAALVFGEQLNLPRAAASVVLIALALVVSRDRTAAGT